MCNRVFDVRSIVSCFNQAAVRFCRQMHRIYFGFHAHERKDVISQVEVFLQVLTSSTESSSNVTQDGSVHTVLGSRAVF